MEAGVKEEKGEGKNGEGEGWMRRSKEKRWESTEERER